VPSAAIKELVAKLSKSGILLSAGTESFEIEEASVEAVAAKLAERHKGDAKQSIIVGKEELENVMKELEMEKIPVAVEAVHEAGYRPVAADVDAQYSIDAMHEEASDGTVDSFVAYFRSRLKKIAAMLNSRSSLPMLLPTLGSMGAYTDGREVTVLGMVSNKLTTKNGNILVILEDETSTAKLIFMHSADPQTSELFNLAGSIVTDEVIAVSGKISGPFVIVKKMVWPDVPIKTKKQVKDDVAIAFISDVHAGSKLFLQDKFMRFINWLNGGIDAKKELAAKVKYLVITGDVVDGIGIYPKQANDLAVLDIYTQYRMFLNFIEAIPDYIHVFILPGNHDAVQLAEPQPSISKEMLGGFSKDNVHFVSNPCYLTLHGIEVLGYHGASLDSVIRAVPGTSYAFPEKAMTELLRRRHLSPIYGYNAIVPSRNDSLVIDKVPDILAMGHLHRNGISSYHGVNILNSGTWQDRTDYQILLGHMPTPCIASIYEASRGDFTMINFNS
jgi:DNA polymerase II small subunit